MKMNSLQLKEKIGQMFMGGFHGTQPSREILTLIDEYRIGGVIYFKRNVREPEQVCRLSAMLQKAAARSSGLPLLIAIDQEGGMVTRIEEGITPMPGNMALGAAGQPQYCRDAARIAGEELRLLGINMNFAPCIDVNNNPDNPVIGVRSYGENPELVGRMGTAAILGYQEAGVAAAAKHFPGHGDTNTDSHLDLPMIRHSMERLHAVELVPFRQAVEAGVDAIMTAHIVFPALEPKPIPATLSRRVIEGLLRRTLRYEGVVVTDCLEMKAIADKFGVEEGAVMAVEAGADIVLISHLFSRQAAAIEAVLHAVESGRIPEARIDESVERLLRLKRKRNMGTAVDGCAQIGGRLALPESWEVSRRITEDSITVVKDEGQLPLSVEEKTYVVWTDVAITSEVDDVLEQEMTLGTALSPFIKTIAEDRIGLNPGAEETRKILETSRSFKQIVFVSYNAAFNPGQIRIVKELAGRKDVRLAVASTRIPYDLQHFPEVKTYIACYENRALTIHTLAKVLMGQLEARGGLPVTISKQYPSVR
ncbi:beta-N-acetylhexosaminidase [Ferviditalea candida]|uniref:Beta-N-acetylhexosaminidase n=1 Tax=Ferviditalea candida TaxID=3108399 RepID=A0ABU5ZKU1_9BACL|nr:beta-N-acetylhexosaminidase [Paenibacillaceae bacterium T2]